MAHGAVHVDHALLEALEELEVERAVVHGVLDLHEQTRVEERHEVRHRVQETVDTLADAVANRQRLEERQDEERTRADAVEAESLAEVFTALLDALVLRDVEQAADADRAVEQEAPELAHGAVELALEEAVHHARHEPDVVEAVRDHHLHAIGHDGVVPLRHRLEHVAVEPAVELEHLLVEVLPGVVLLVRRVGLRERGRRGGLGHEQRGRRLLGGVETIVGGDHDG